MLVHLPESNTALFHKIDDSSPRGKVTMIDSYASFAG